MKIALLFLIIFILVLIFGHDWIFHTESTSKPAIVEIANKTISSSSDFISDSAKVSAEKKAPQKQLIIQHDQGMQERKQQERKEQEKMRLILEAAKEDKYRTEFSAIKDLNAALENDVIDYEWSSKVTNQIKNVFYTENNDLRYSELGNHYIDCRSKLCKVTIYDFDLSNHLQNDQGNQLMNDILRLRPEGTPDDVISRGASIKTDTSKTGELSYYISRTE